MRFAGTICGWNLKTSRVPASTSTLSSERRVAVRLVVPKRLHASEVLEPPALWVEERPVDAEVVGVAVHVRDRPAEGDHLVTQRAQELLEAVGLAVGLGERHRVPQGRSGRVAQVPPGICL